ncbi:hypothetical protein [Thiocapsa marina]|uniref:DUF5666 domain-containing protein n=1 Tax=Thiocapsa marina 5811 TaxID=768671 RepID=F9UA42_9GAMM|nr:hypothetical protein [Thiocapsa marina]EGV18990.1 hypothetical protein ThimaDRAFT_1794 [Thiocapsa marina 5811]
MKNPSIPAMTLAFSALVFSLGVLADDDFYGIVDGRPLDGAVGDWVIGGRTFPATNATKIDTDDGPLDIGVCASVDTEGQRVEEIESEPAQTCA